jgi:hypothetical protein
MEKLNLSNKLTKVQKDWIKALLSGKYKQAKGQLRKLDSRDNVKGYCCLGVACDIINPKGWGKRQNFERLEEHDLGSGLLDDEGLEKLFGDDMPSFTYEFQEQLANLNDASVPFELIAGTIHEEIKDAYTLEKKIRIDEKKSKNYNE